MCLGSWLHVWFLWELRSWDNFASTPASAFFVQFERQMCLQFCWNFSCYIFLFLVWGRWLVRGVLSLTAIFICSYFHHLQTDLPYFLLFHSNSNCILVSGVVSTKLCLRLRTLVYAILFVERRFKGEYHKGELGRIWGGGVWGIPGATLETTPFFHCQIHVGCWHWLINGLVGEMECLFFYYQEQS